jgi:hypothetical protein
MIIVEGFDNCGKSTLIKTLEEEFKPEEIVKSPGPVSYRELFVFADKYISALEKLRLKNSPLENYPIIHDRFPVFSDQVYGPVLRGINPFAELNEGQWLVARLMRNAPVLIYCRPSTEKITKFEDGREQMEGVINNALILLGKYDDLMLQWERRGGRHIIRYNYEQDSVEELIEVIKKRTGGNW